MTEATKPGETACGAKPIDVDAFEFPHVCPRCRFPFDCTIKPKKPKTKSAPQ